MWLRIFALALPAVLTACGYVSKYEEQVYDWEPVYCYQSIGGVECYKEPKYSDSRRLVNYFGPDPSRYDAPDAPDVPDLQAPKEIDTWVKDAEPVPESALSKAQVRAYNARLAGLTTSLQRPPVNRVARVPQPAPPVEAPAANEAPEQLSFFGKLRRGIFGPSAKPMLANRPAPPPTLPAPASGTL